MGRAQRVLILQMGHPPEYVRDRVGEQCEWFFDALAGHDYTITVLRPFLDEALPTPDSFDIAVISGSWSMVTDKEAWSERVAAWVPEVIRSGRRLLGICYGHQVMAHALGGVVDYNPCGREVGIKTVTFTEQVRDDTFFIDAPASFAAHLSHEQSVISAPEEATVLAYSQQDGHQILRYAPNALSFQFHPEFTPQIMRACIERRRSQYLDEGVDVGALLDELSATPYATQLLLRFIAQQ